MAGLLIHSPADILRRCLITLGLGADPPSIVWPVFADSIPATPDNVIVILDTDGRQDGRLMYDGSRQEHHGVKIQVRSTIETVGYVKARAIAVALDVEIYDETITIDGTNYLIHCTNRTGDVVRQGKEMGTSRRSIFNVMAQLTIRKLS